MSHGPTSSLVDEISRFQNREELTVVPYTSFTFGIGLCFAVSVCLVNWIYLLSHFN